MRRLLLIISVFLLSQAATADTKKGIGHPEMDMTTANQAHASIKASVPHAQSEQWSKDQTQQVELEKKYKKGIADNPENKKNYAYLAGLYLSNNKSGKAIEAYQEAIMHDPQNPKLFAAISIAYLHQQKFGMAKAMADQALKIDPSLKQINKINEYIAAKEAVIDSASTIPAGGKMPQIKASRNLDSMHGSVMHKAKVSGYRPNDMIHTLKK